MKWPVARLGDEITIKGGGTPSRRRAEFYQGDVPWATIKDLTGLYLERTEEHITQEALESSAANLIPAGNVILATRVGFGKVAINIIDVAINQDLWPCSARHGSIQSILSIISLRFLTQLRGKVSGQPSKESR
jgi:type I restriction enzyme, S subunit